MKISVKLGVILLSIIIIGEIALRIYGFCNAPLYFSSKSYEYMAMPNQDRIRFGNHYHYNSYSQRSEEPDTTKQIILGLGDSVLFGGVQTDQDSLATSLFSTQTGIQMLNISAGSWGPDNCAAYLKEKGLFNAKIMFLVVSSHDAYDNMDFHPTVGIHPSYPTRQYKLAWAELWDRYVLPHLFKKIKKSLDSEQVVTVGIKKKGTEFNLGFDQLKQISDSTHIPLIVYLHAERQEKEIKKYNEQGEEIIKWARQHRIKLIEELNYPFDNDDYRDEIHINAKGQRKLAEIMTKELSPFFQHSHN